MGATQDHAPLGVHCNPSRGASAWGFTERRGTKHFLLIIWKTTPNVVVSTQRLV
jgi:hypothetical protein